MWTHSITDPWRRRRIVVVLLVCSAVVTSCGHDQPTEDDVGAAATIGVTSAAFADGANIPVEFTCDGKEESPPLAWTGDAADKPAAWALVVDDPDAGGTVRALGGARHPTGHPVDTRRGRCRPGRTRR